MKVLAAIAVLLLGLSVGASEAKAHSYVPIGFKRVEVVTFVAKRDYFGRVVRDCYGSVVKVRVVKIKLVPIRQYGY